MDEAGRLAVLRARLAAPMPEDRLWGWLGPLLVTAFGSFLRFNRLRVPKALIFDETYYPKDAWSILKHGVELRLLKPEIANPMIVAGHTNFFARCDHTSACGEYVVQPEVGKLLIAAGEWLFGLNPFGWRCSARWRSC
jgi:dolichyl-phosphate-mannose--protein O-mannosyl transferase